MSFYWNRAGLRRRKGWGWAVVCVCAVGLGQIASRARPSQISWVVKPGRP
jgi:hypothetical protein